MHGIVTRPAHGTAHGTRYNTARGAAHLLQVGKVAMIVSVLTLFASFFKQAYASSGETAQFWMSNALSLTVPLIVALRVKSVSTRVRSDTAARVYPHACTLVRVHVHALITSNVICCAVPGRVKHHGGHV